MPNKENQSTLIYVLFDENGPRYVGRTCNLKERLAEHRCKKLWLVSHFVIEIVAPDDRWQDRERFWIRYYSQWYKLENKTSGGEGCSYRSEETRKKISEGQKGKKRGPEFGEKMRLINTGKHMTPESRLKMSQSGKGRPKSEEHKEKIRQAHLGKKMSPEAVERMRQRRWENKSPEERKATEETKRKISQGMVGHTSQLKGRKRPQWHIDNQVAGQIAAKNKGGNEEL